MKIGLTISPHVCLVFAILFSLTLFFGCIVRDDDPIALNNGVGEQCTRDRDCRDSLGCADDFTCQPTGTVEQGGYCELTGDCLEGLYCTFGRYCEPGGESELNGVCLTTDDCMAGLICVIQGLSATCQQPGAGDIGAECTSQADCLPGLVCPVSETGSSFCASPVASFDPEPPPFVPYWAGLTCEDNSGAHLAYFSVPRSDESVGEFFRLPFPNDIRRTDDGLDLSGYPHPQTQVEWDILGHYIEALEQDVDGFARNPVVTFRFSDGLDYDSLADFITFVNITEDSTSYGNMHGYSWYATNGRGTKYLCNNWLTVSTGPGYPLKPGETYAVILDNVILDAEGSSFNRDEDLDALLSSSPPSDSELTHAYDAYEPLRNWLEFAKVDPETVLNAAVFTTQTTDVPMAGMREAIRSHGLALASELTVCNDMTTSPCDDGTPLRACESSNLSYYEIHGRLEIPRFQEGTVPFETLGDGGEIKTDASGIPQVVENEQVCFAMTVPRDVTIPDVGFPVVLYGHGTGGSFRGAISSGVAQALAEGEIDGTPIPIATIAIDFPVHGDRRGDSELTSDVLFFNFSNPRAARDNVIQGAADLMSVIYWAENFVALDSESPTGETIRFDPDRIGIFAHSQGATHAALMIPYEPSLLAVVLSGEGGDLTESLLNKVEPVDIAGIIPYALMDVTAEGALPGGATHPALALFQTFFEVSDPVNYGGLLLPGDDERPARHLFMTYGLGDSYSPEATQRAYARSAGLTLVTPVLTEDSMSLQTADPPLQGNITAYKTTWTHGIRQYQPDEGDDGHFVSTRTEMGQQDTIRFLLQALSGQIPQIGQ